MSLFRDEMAKTAPTYTSLMVMAEAARKQQQKLYGWVGTRFFEVYPGSRTIDHTDFVPHRYANKAL